jgi:hypothetical protein
MISFGSVAKTRKSGPKLRCCPRRATATLLAILTLHQVERNRYAGSDFEQRYAGNICVVGKPGRPSIADQRKVFSSVGEAVGRLMNDKSNGIYLSQNDDDTVRPEMVVLTPQLYDKFADIGFTAVDPDPWLRPIE